MANMNIPSPHFYKNPHCLRCRDGALKYNHCAWCGDDFTSHESLVDHFRKSACGISMVKWLAEVA